MSADQKYGWPGFGLFGSLRPIQPGAPQDSAASLITPA